MANKAEALSYSDKSNADIRKSLMVWYLFSVGGETRSGLRYQSLKMILCTNI